MDGIMVRGLSTKEKMLLPCTDTGRNGPRYRLGAKHGGCMMVHRPRSCLQSLHLIVSCLTKAPFPNITNSTSLGSDWPASAALDLRSAFRVWFLGSIFTLVQPWLHPCRHRGQSCDGCAPFHFNLSCLSPSVPPSSARWPGLGYPSSFAALGAGDGAGAGAWTVPHCAYCAHSGRRLPTGIAQVCHQPDSQRGNKGTS